MARFTILEKLAEGAAVDVFLAKDNGTGANLVIEGMRSEALGHPDVVKRVFTEATLRHTLDHPNLARRVQAPGGGPQARPCWMSEPVKGDTLRKLLEARKKLSALDALSVTLALSDVVSYLHQRGFTHGCLSPKYILVDPSQRQLSPKLLDSGLSLCRVPDTLAARRLLVHPEYLSPERVQGQRADERSDVYALGVLLFELVTGSAPYSDRDVNTTRQKHLRDPLPRLPAGLEFLEPVIHGCLAKAPASRFDGMQSLTHALVRARSVASARAQRAPLASVEPSDPKPFGSYQPVTLLGEGAMGQVYLARHQHTERKMAIKVLRPEHVQSREMVARFFQEAKAANKVTHQHIAQIFDCVDERASNTGTRCYLVMEFLTGATLGELMRKQKLSVQRIVAIVRQVCQALEAAHLSGVIHRDIKPENIFLISQGGNDDFVKLVDFGIAKLCWDGGNQAAPLTANGEMLGTPSYMAPEQLSAKTVDSRADIYALGTVLYELLGGRRPFKAKSLGELLMAVARTPPAYLGDTTAAGEALPLDLRRVVMRCLEKDPGKRPQNMGELAELLRLTSSPRAAPMQANADEPARSARPLPPGLTGLFDGDPDEPLELMGQFEPVETMTGTAVRRKAAPPRPAQVAAPAPQVAAPAAAAVPPPLPAMGPRVLEARFATRKRAVMAGQAQGAQLLLFVPGAVAEEGLRVKVVVSFGDTTRQFELSGVTSPAPAGASHGCNVGFTGTEKRRAAEMLAFCANIPLAMGTARSRRVPVTIPCKVKVDQATAAGTVSDLSRTGAFVTLAARVGKIGSIVKVQLEPGALGLGGTWLAGTIVWRGEKDGFQGVGIEFSGAHATKADVLAKYLEKSR